MCRGTQEPSSSLRSMLNPSVAVIRFSILQLLLSLFPVGNRTLYFYFMFFLLSYTKGSISYVLLKSLFIQDQLMDCTAS